MQREISECFESLENIGIIHGEFVAQFFLLSKTSTRIMLMAIM